MVARRRVRFRPPGVKPWTRIGPLGPFRGRLGLQWVIAPLVLGVILVVFGWLLLFRPSGPGQGFVAAGPASAFPEGQARAVGIPGVFVGRTGGAWYAVVQDGGCNLQYCSGRYVDCRGATYGIDGRSLREPGALDLLPVKVFGGTVWVDPAHPIARPAPPAPATPGPACP